MSAPLTANSDPAGRARTSLLLTALVTALAGTSLPARGDCVQVGTSVTCTGLDADGFPDDPGGRPPASDGLDLTVEPGAVVGNAGAGPTIWLLDDNTATVEATGSVTAAGGSTAILGGGTVATGNRVTNTGDIEATGAGSVGIDLGIAGQVVNQIGGRVAVSAGGAGTAIGIRVGTNGLVTHAGDVQVDGVGAVGISASGGSVTSSGSVTVTGADGVGIAARAVDHGGTITVTGDGAIGLRLDQAGANAVNTGSIHGGSGPGAGVRMSEPTPGMLEFKTFVNEASGFVGAASGVALQGSESQERVLNRGRLAGDVRLAGGDDFFAWGDASRVDGVLDGGAGTDVVRLFQSDAASPVSDSFDLDGPRDFEGLAVGYPGDTGTWTLTGTGSGLSTIVVVSGDVQIPAYRVIQADLYVRGGSYRFGYADPRSQLSGVAGDVTVWAPGQLVLNGTNSVFGDLDLSQGGTLVSHFSTTGGTSGLTVSGSARLDGAVLALVQSDTGPVSPRSFSPLSARDGFQGRFSGVSVLGATGFVRALLSYDPSPTASRVYVQLTSSYAALGRSHNERAVGAFLDQAVAIGVDPEFQAFLDSFDPISNAEVTSLLDRLHGAAYDAQTSVSFATTSRYADMLAERPASCDQPVSPYRLDRPSLDPCGQRRYTPWVKGFGLFTDRNGSRGEEDWSHAGGGIALGLDKRVPGDFILSGLVGGSRSVLDLDSGGDGSYTSLELGLGVGWQRAALYVRGILVYAHGWHDTYREVGYPAYARLDSDHESDAATLRVDAGYAFEFRVLELEPVLGIEYSHLAQDSIHESNGGVIDLEIDSRSDDLVASEVGVRAGSRLETRAASGNAFAWPSGTWRPELRGSWRQVWTGYDRSFDGRLAGAPGGTPSLEVQTQDAQWGAVLGGGVSFQPADTLATFGLDYGAFVGDGTTSHTVLATLRIPL